VKAQLEVRHKPGHEPTTIGRELRCARNKAGRELKRPVPEDRYEATRAQAAGGRRRDVRRNVSRRAPPACAWRRQIQAEHGSAAVGPYPGSHGFIDKCEDDATVRIASQVSLSRQTGQSDKVSLACSQARRQRPSCSG
jgi:hypothetical protein